MPSSLSLKELLNLELPAARWAVDGLVEAGAVTMVSALWGQRKSWLCLHIAICVAGGSPVFGTYVTEKKGVLVVNEEDTLRQIQERMNILAPPSDELPIYFQVGQGFRLDESGAASIVAEAKSKGISLVIFDSLRAIHGAEENESGPMQAVMNRLKHLTNEGLTVVFTHHNRKPSPGKQASDSNGEETRGSSAINAAVHGHLSIEATKGEDGQEYVVVRQSKNKSAERLDSFRVRVEKSPDGHLSFVHAGEHKADSASTKTADSTMAALRASERWMSVKELVACGIAKEKAIRDALANLNARGLIAAKERKTLEADGRLAPTPDGQHNEIFYAENSIACLVPLPALGARQAPSKPADHD
jgi:hypothetical protein